MRAVIRQLLLRKVLDRVKTHSKQAVKLRVKTGFRWLDYPTLHEWWRRDKARASRPRGPGFESGADLQKLFFIESITS